MRNTRRHGRRADDDQDAARVAFGYVRVSTDRQGDEGVSLDAQKERIKAWATLKGCTLVHTYEEVQSAKTVSGRPVFQQAIAAAIEAKGVLVVAKLDRASRDTIDTLLTAKQLTDAGADLACLSEGDIDTTTSDGRFLLTLHAGLAERERGKIRERTIEALDHKRSRNEALGNTPFGYGRGDNGQLVPNEAEAKALLFCLQGWARHRSYAYCVRSLMEAGHKPRQLPWSCGSVQRILSTSRQRLAPADQDRRDEAEAVRASGQYGSDRRGFRAIAKALNARGVTPPETRWSRGQIRRLVKTYFRAEEIEEKTEAVVR